MLILVSHGRATRTLLALSFCVVATSALAQPTELPKSPPGFHWERAEEVKAAFLVPNSWHFKREKHPNTFAYFATREDIVQEGKFVVGLTVNVIPRIQGRDAVAYAKQFVQTFPAGKKLLKSWDASMGPFVGGGCLVEDEVAIMHTLMVANPKTNTLYLFIFEAPKAEWEGAWKTGQQIVQLILLDDEV
jgi:hypothetical protein